MDTVIHAPWNDLLGSRLIDPGTSAFLYSLHPSPKRLRVEGFGLRYLVYLMDGIEFIHLNERIIHIHIHVEPDSSSRAWVGNLPYGLQRDMTRDVVHGLLGKPQESRCPPSGELIDKWMMGQSHVSLVFEPLSLRLELITMSRESTEATTARREPKS